MVSAGSECRIHFNSTTVFQEETLFALVRLAKQIRLLLRIKLQVPCYAPYELYCHITHTYLWLNHLIYML